MIKKERKMTSLAQSLTQTLVTGLAVIFILLALFLNGYMQHLLESQTNERVHYILSTQAENLARPLWDLQVDNIRTTLKNIVQDENIQAARAFEIINGSQVLVEQYGWENLPKQISVLSQNITYFYESNLGVLEIAVNYLPIKKKIREIIWVTGILFGSISILLGLLVYYILRRDIDPVTKLSESLVNVDYFTHKIEKIPSKSWEINNLFDALINMQKIMQGQTHEIQEQKSVLDTTIDKMPLGMFVEDMKNDGRLLLANDMFKQLFNVRITDYRHKKITDLLVPQDAEFMESVNENILQNKRMVETFKHKVHQVHDGFFIAHIIKAPVLDKDGNVKQIITLIEDVTDEVEAQRALLQHMQDLERSNAELEDFSYIASHDLKEPLRGIHNFSEFLVEDCADKLGKENMEMLKNISHLSQRMEDFLNVLLHYSRLGKTKMAIEETDMNKVVENTLALLTQTIEKNNAAIELADKLPTISCDRARIGKVFYNLISNAIKYNNNKEKKVTIGYTTTHKRFPDEIVFYVQDNGIGIEEKYLNSIFKIFKRLHGRDEYGGGTGAGLTIAQKIIKQHGGEIWAESPGRNKGTTFYFTLPEKIEPNKNDVTI